MNSNRLNSEEQAVLELKHIQLELSHCRAEHMRHFVDQYYCHKKGFVNRNGRANWGAIYWTDWVSRDAHAAKPNKGLVVKEHVVPLNVIKSRLRELYQDGNSASLDSIAEVLDELTQFATITKEEDKLLRTSKLSRTMPEGYWIEGHPYHRDIMARYRHVGIDVEWCP